jgi:two-component system chemotaxis sensor kinase CheA
MARLVHDLSGHIGKKINLVTIKGETEVDKTVSELINDPLVHIIRNACDHGIGSPEERLSVGKKEFGTITISAEHRSGAVWISIKDDGRGLNREKILKKAIEQKLISPDDQLADDDIWKLILLPGFSTASVISDISGRGVGMDVVQKNIEMINGQIYIKTVQGQGTEFVIRIPLTLAIIDGMIIKVKNSLYIIPTLSIRQSLKYDENMITYSPEGEKILKFHEKLIPIIHLANLFEKEQNNDIESGILIIVEEGDDLVALFANDIVGQQQVVIKGLSEYVKKARGTSSCTILGDGSIALILDLHSLSEMALEKVERNNKIPQAKLTVKPSK